MVLSKSYDSYQYSKYFDTHLPTHWLEKRLGYLSKENRTAFVDGPFGSDLKTDDYKDEGVPLIQLNNIRGSKHLLQNMKFVTEAKKQQLIRHVANPGDVVIAKMAEPVARSAVVTDYYSEYVIVADCVKMTPNLGLVDLHYLIWAINCDYVRINAELVSTGTTRIRINLGELKKLKIPFPPYNEQQQIATFLDHETAKIDTLIEKQQQLIKLLKEKRQAMISHAVTKGLNPDAPMHDSGVVWLGEVPEHWEVKRIKNLSSLISKGTTPSTMGGGFVDEGIRFFKAENIGKSLLVMQSPTFYITKEVDALIDRSRLKEDDVLVIIAGATTGLASIVTSDVLPANTNQAVSFIRPLKSQFSKLIVRWLSTDFAQRIIWTVAVQAAQPNLSMEDLGNIPIVVSPFDELNEIMAIIDERLSKFDNMISKSQSMIGLMQERRTALISAAVTGKIDVRNWQAPEQNQTNKEDAA